MGWRELQAIKAAAGQPKQKKIYRIPPKSAKKIKQEAEAKELRGGEDTLMEQWFKARRKQMTGTCSCGCAQPSQKKDDTYFRHSCCHIFPKARFESIMYHPLNFVELAFWGGCHTTLDEGGMDKWPNTACWDDIKEKFHVLAPLLTDEERATKFYSKLEKLIYNG